MADPSADRDVVPLRIETSDEPLPEPEAPKPPWLRRPEPEVEPEPDPEVVEPDEVSPPAVVRQSVAVERFDPGRYLPPPPLERPQVADLALWRPLANGAKWAVYGIGGSIVLLIISFALFLASRPWIGG